MEDYLEKIQKYFKDKNSSEMSYRAPFQNFLESIFTKEDKYIVQHDQKAINGNKPDFIVLRNNIPLLYIETKKIGEDLNKIEKSEQADRYFGYDNLIITDYLNFRFYRYGKKYNEEISLGKINFQDRHIDFSKETDIKHLSDTILDFYSSHKEQIKSGKHLAEVMGGKARRIRDEINSFFDKNNETEKLSKIFKIIKTKLIHDLDEKKFADMYAQTLVYGLFVARYNDLTKDTFSRQEARDLIPDSNYFLKHFFDHIAGIDFDKRLSIIVDELCEVFIHSQIDKLLDDFYKTEKENKDPIIHFYEDFLHEYDPEIRKQMGAYYTPISVVDFIVRSVDEILIKDFNLNDGLNNASKLDNGNYKVQILDPATGTGTFISRIIRLIYKRIINKKQQGSWTSYVHNNLLPRIHGFELMMAPYTIAHLKLGIAFRETGFTIFHKRLGIYLTNTLENIKQNEVLSSIGFDESLTLESQEANKVKNDLPIMCVIGNPPYSISSNNKSEWILSLIEDYKKDLNERKINLDDDYIKFIRFGQYMIDKNGDGILAYISNNSFISGITHRKMRESLLRSFDKIYILDLHGNARIKEKSPDGSKDQNVFDIMQGVSINIFVKNNQKKENELGKVYHYDLYGDRKNKFEFLDKNILSLISWNELNYSEPYYFFVPKDFGLKAEYDKGFKFDEMFNTFSVGIGTKVDSISIDFDNSILKSRVEDILQNKYGKDELINKFELNPKTTWEYERALTANFLDNKFVEYDYRPFDTRFIFYDEKFISRNRAQVMDNFFKKDNFGLEVAKTEFVCFISNKISDEHFGGAKSYKFPLYLYTEQNQKISNLNKEISDKMNEKVGGTTPENILDYIYAVLHSPSYREKYKEFLKIDFPKVPYPENKNKFWEVVKIGEKLRGLHLMTDKIVNDFITIYPITGDNLVDKISYKDGNVYINKDQYFGNVSEIAWNFYIGGYQPSQKYLKDRKGRNLTSDEIEHYQKIIKVLVETDKLMKEVDNII